jgi:hypothetical protein
MGASLIGHTNRRVGGDLLFGQGRRDVEIRPRIGPGFLPPAGFTCLIRDFACPYFSDRVIMRSVCRTRADFCPETCLFRSLWAGS